MRVRQVKRMRHFMARCKRASKVRHKRSIIQFIGGSMQERDWLSRERRAYGIESARYDATDKKEAAYDVL